jgi:hypothetical protein
MTATEWRERGVATTGAPEATRDDVARAHLVVGATAVVHVCMAPLRRLTFDEAYYACASARGVPWPVPQHPPMLGLLLRTTAHLTSLPVELRVRLVAVVMSAVTSLGVARLASLVAQPRHAARAYLIGATLASWGVMAMAGGVMTVPECALLAALSWLACVATRCAERDASGVEIAALSVLTAVACASKVSAIFCVVAVGAALASRRSFRAAAAVALGLGAAFPYCVVSLVGQTAHAVGRGPWLSEGHTGVASALATVVLSVVCVFGPAAVWIGARSRQALGRIPGGAAWAALIALAILASAVTSGRPSEVHWFAPASVPLYAAAAATLASRPRGARAVLASHVLPTVLAVVAWCMPLGVLERRTQLFAEAPHVAFSPVDGGLAWTRAAQQTRFIPPYGMSAWRCLYAGRCED